jgi:hypothetical protein
MTTAASTTFAHRLGRAVGLAVRFCIHDRNPKIRWAKRALVAVLLLFALFNSFNWLASAAIWVGIIALAVFGYRSPGQAWTDDEWERFVAPHGRDFLGRPLDVTGEVKNPYDITS